MSLARELPFALRRLWRHPGFSLACVLTLGVGMGATVAMFAVIHAVVLNPLPYPASDRLVRLDHAAPGVGNDGGLQLTQGLYLLYRESSRSVAEFAVFEDTDVTLTGAGVPRRLSATVTTHELAGVLRTPARVGRFLDEGDGRPGAPPVTVLSHALWQSAFGADPEIVGKTVLLNGVGVEVVGVMPARFAFPSRETDLWLPRTVDPAAAGFGSFTLDAVGRLRDGATAADAREELQGLIPRLVDRFPGTGRQVVEDARLAAIVTPLREAIVGDVATTLWVLLGTVALLLVIALVNVTNLLVVRLEGRHRDVAIRTALGASPRAIAAFFLGEAAWLAVTGGLVAAGFAGVALGLVRRYGPAGLPRLAEVAFGPAAWAAVAVLTAGAGGLLAVLPLVVRRPDTGETLKQGHRTTAGRRRFGGRHALIASQTAFALLLVLAAGLMTRSFWHLTRVETGFDPDGVLTFEIGLPASAYPTRERAVALHDALLERLRALPGVERVGATTCLPLCGSWAGNPWARQDRPVAPGEIPPILATRRVSEAYLETMRIGVVRGRSLERRDREQMTGAAVINQEAAAKLFPGEDPIGKAIYHGTAPDRPDWYRVVGVVENAPVRSLTDEPAPIVYLPLLHRDGAGLQPRLLAYAVRSPLPPSRLVEAIRAEVRVLDPALPVAAVRPLPAIVRTAGAGMAFTMVLLVLAAAMALFLGLVGVYSVIAYMVSLRMPEFGLRLAMGARSEDLSRLVFRQGGAMVLAGVAAGLAGAVVLSRFMRAMVFGVSPTDPATFAGVTVLLGAAAWLAIRGPARRAASADPMTSLRAD